MNHLYQSIADYNKATNLLNQGRAHLAMVAAAKANVAKGTMTAPEAATIICEGTAK